MSSTLDLVRVKTLLGPLAGRFDIDAVGLCDSTNSALMERALRKAPSGSVLVADTQSAGRGRRGRSWQSSAGASLTFSVLWRFSAHEQLSGLSLVAGVAIAQALRAMGAEDAMLKWPNDILLRERKLGGILVELSQTGGRAAAVIGIGLNLRSEPQWAENIDQPYAALAETSVVLEREHMLAGILNAWVAALDCFKVQGFAAFQQAFTDMHILHGRRVSVMEGDDILSGYCVGVDAQGAMLLDTPQGCKAVWAGDVTLLKPGSTL